MALQVTVKSHRAWQIVEEQAKKNRTGRLKWENVIKNKKYSILFSENNLISNHEDHQKRLKQAFKKGFKQIKAVMIDKNGLSVPRYYYDTEKDEFVRRNQFQQIKNQQTLLKFIEKSSKGVLVSDQLLQFTYKQVQRDIQKLLLQKKIKKINSSNKVRKEYYIFGNVIQMQYGLSDTYDFFGQKEYISLCKENYKYYQELNDDDTIISSNTMYLPTSQRFNQWVVGYAQLKKQWLLKNQEKEMKRIKN